MEKATRQPPALFRVIRQLTIRYFKNTVGRSAAELAYYLLFALFPALIFLNAALSLLHLSDTALMDNLAAVLPSQVLEIIRSYLSYIQELDARVLLYACLVLSVLAVSRAMRSLMRSVSRAYDIPRQGFLVSIAAVMMAVAMMVVTIVLLVLVMISENLLLQINQVITIPAVLIRIWDFLRLTVAPLLMFAFLAGFYAVVSFGKYRFHQALPGAGAAVVGWFLLTSGFSYYMSNISRYSILYGSLAAFMVLMLWLHLTGVVLIMGGELNHILAQEHEAAKRSAISIKKEENPK